MKKLKLNLIMSIAYQFVTVVYGFILPRLLINTYGSELYGLTQSIKQFLGLISLLDLGVGQVVRSALYKPLAEKNSMQISRVMVAGRKFYRTLACILLGYIGVLLVVYPLIIDRTFGFIFVVTLVAIISLGSFMQYFLGIINEQLLHADQQSYFIYGIHIVCTVANLLLCVFMVYLNVPIHIIMLTTTIVFSVKPVFYVIYIRKHYNIDKRAHYDKETIPQKWNGIAQHVSAVVLDGTDNVVLTLFSTLSNVSVYSVYYMVIGSIQGFYQTIAVGIQSAAGEVWAKQDFEKIKKMFSTAEFYLHTTTVLLFSCVGVLIVPFVQVYTNGISDKNYVQPLFALIFTVAYGIRCLRTPYNIWILAAGHFKQTQRCHIIAASLNLLLSIIMVWKWGLIGVAIGTFIAMCYQTIWMAVYAVRNLTQSKMKNMIKRFVVDIVMTLAISLATCWISLSQVNYLGWIVMSVKVVVISSVCAVVVSFVFYREECLDLVRKLIQKFFPNCKMFKA